MASRTEIANFALGHFGQYRIADIDQRDPVGNAVRDVWNIVRDKCLRVYPWNFAQADATLSKVVVETVPRDWAYVWALPADYLRLTSCNGVLSGTRDTLFTVRGQTLLTVEDTAEIVYTRRVVETELWDATFVEAFSFALAEAVAPHLTLSTAESDRLAGRKKNSGLEAMLSGSIESRPLVRRAAEGSLYAAATRGGCA